MRVRIAASAGGGHRHTALLNTASDLVQGSPAASASLLHAFRGLQPPKMASGDLPAGSTQQRDAAALPPPQSLMDLDKPWLLKLATCSFLYGADRRTLFRTCTFFRDAVSQHRRATLSFDPFDTSAEAFPPALDRLCTVLRRSGNVWLEFWCRDWPIAEWPATEPHVTHLLVSAMARLGRKEGLLNVNSIAFQNMELSGVVPAWLSVVCPHLEGWDAGNGFVTRHLGALPPETTAVAERPAPLPRLRELCWCPEERMTREASEHVRRQLAALPSLAYLDVTELWLMQGQLSGSVTELRVWSGFEADHAARIAELLPNLRHLDLTQCQDEPLIDDAGLEALMYRLPRLEKLSVAGLALQRSHVHRFWPWPLFEVDEVDIDSFARLPLELIPACTLSRDVIPSTDAQAVVRVAKALRRWDAACTRLSIKASDMGALLVTVAPLCREALDAQQACRVAIEGMEVATAAHVLQLGQQLPPHVSALQVHATFVDPGARRALLPSLPASVLELKMNALVLPEWQEEVVSVCSTAVRPIKLRLASWYRGEFANEQVRQQLRARAEAASNRLVTLLWD